MSQSVAMALSGHKTASVYRRYRIVAEDDLRETLARMQASLMGHPVGTITPLREGESRDGPVTGPAQFPHTRRGRLVTAPSN